MATSDISTLPTDVWVRILSCLDPQDILLFGTCSKFCSNLLITNDRLWVETATRRWLFPRGKNPVSCKEKFLKLLALERNPTIEKPLPLEIVSSSCDEYSTEYGLQNLITSDSKCYCTKAVSKNVDLVLKLAEADEGQWENVVMFVTQVDIRDPPRGYSAPLDTSLVYVFHSKPEVTLLAAHNDMTEEEYNEKFASKPVEVRQHFCEPVFFSSCKYRRANSKSKEDFTWRYRLNRPVPVGKWVVLKMLKAFGSSPDTNIDVGYFGLRGFLLDLNTCEIVHSPDVTVSDADPGCSVM